LKTQSIRKPTCRVYPDKGGRCTKCRILISEEGFIALT